MKISASYWIFEGGLEGTLPIHEAMEQASQLGFDAIELGIASQGVLTHLTTQAECEAICAMANKNGLEISGVASGESWGSSPTSSDVKVREKILDFTKKALQITQWLGTDAYLYVPGAVDVFFYPRRKLCLMMCVMNELRRLFQNYYPLQKNWAFQLPLKMSGTSFC